MTQKIALLLCLCLLGCSDPEPAETPFAAPPSDPVEVGPGVHVAGAHGEDVVVGPGGVAVNGDDHRVRIGPDGVHVRSADGRDVRVGAGGVAVEAAPPAPAPTEPPTDALQAVLDQVPAVAATGAPAALVCDGSQRVIRNNVALAGGAGPAIAASGSCTVICNNCRLTSRRVAVAASGSADVTLNNCTISAPVAIAASGVADVTSNRSTIRGQTTRSGNAELTIN